MTTKEHRKAISLGVKLAACLILLGHHEDRIHSSVFRARRYGVLKGRIEYCLKKLGFTDADIAAGIQWDHDPALVFREIIDGKMIPDPNDPHFIKPMRKADHKEKTSGKPHLTAGSDQHIAGKIRRLTGETKKRKGRQIRSRGFQKRSKS